MKCHDIQLMQHCPTSCITALPHAEWLYSCSQLCTQQTQQRSSGWGVSICPPPAAAVPLHKRWDKAGADIPPESHTLPLQSQSSSEENPLLSPSELLLDWLGPQGSSCPGQWLTINQPPRAQQHAEQQLAKKPRMAAHKPLRNPLHMDQQLA